MSRISDYVRRKVEDLSVSDRYGDWGMLTRVQRKKIRELCDLCDSFERELDILMKRQELQGGWTREGNKNTCQSCGFYYFATSADYRFCPMCGLNSKK